MSFLIRLRKLLKIIKLQNILEHFSKSTIVLSKKYYRFSKKLILLCQKDYNLQRKSSIVPYLLFFFIIVGGSIVNNKCLVITFLLNLLLHCALPCNRLAVILKG